MRWTDLLIGALLLALVSIPMLAGAALYANTTHTYEFTHGPGCPIGDYDHI